MGPAALGDAPVTDWTRDLARPERALAIAAHPDDVEFGCGATLARWAAAGTTIVHVICTDGSKGTWDAGADTAALVERRIAEQRAASIALGGDGTIEMLGAVDGELDADLAMRKLVAAAVRRHRPDVVLGHDPWKRYRLHPDHRAAGWLAIDGIVAARDPHFFPDLDDPPHRPHGLLLFEADQPDHLELADDATLARRCAALECHVSQFETTHLQHLDGPLDDQLAAFRAAERAKLAAMGALDGVPLAEAFKLMTEL
jgi:LmbE family N-acetylglucosaminyl deacetylase